MGRPPLAAILAAAVSFAASGARADDRAIAQEAFREGRELMAAGRVAEACPKFSAAAQLSPTAGVRLNLSECLARLGKPASAWAKANEALAMAVRGGDAAAAALARQKMAALAPQLSYLTLEISRPPPRGLEVALDGEGIPMPLWGTPLPIDPGEHQVTARSPGASPVTAHTTIGSAERATLALPMPVRIPSSPEHDEAPAARSLGTARTLALVSGGLGVIGVGVGAAAGIDAAVKKSQYQQRESGGACSDAQCSALSGQALSAANASTVAFIVGGALVGCGGVLWLVAPRSDTARVAMAPALGPRVLGMSVEGDF
jgi:hypothetical protein